MSDVEFKTITDHVRCSCDLNSETCHIFEDFRNEPCHFPVILLLLIDFMSHAYVEFKEWPCRPVE